MQPLGRKILVRDILDEVLEESTETLRGVKTTIVTKGKTDGGIFIPATVKTHYRKVKIEEISWDSDTKLKPGDICLCNPGGVELETGLWLCDEGLLDCKL